MPVRVEVPIRLSVDAPALDEHGDVLAEAVEAALTRALSNSRTEVLEPRGGYVGVAAAAPVFTWSGTGLGGVDPQVLADTEATVAETIRNVLDATGVADWGASGAPVPLQEPPSERIVDERFVPLLRLYRVPSYDAGGAEEAVAVESTEPVVESTEPKWGWTWLRVTSSDLFERAFALEIEIAEEEGERFTDYVGAIYLHHNGEMFISVGKYGKQGLFDEPITGLFDLEVVGEGKDAKFRKVPVDLPAHERYRLVYHGAGTSSEDRIRIFRDEYAGTIRNLVYERAERLGTVSRAEIDARMEQIIDHAVGEMVADLPTGKLHFLKLHVGGARYLLSVAFDVPTDLDTRLLPLVRFGQIPPEGRGGGDGDGAEEGGEGGPQYGVVTGKDGEGKSGGRIFPMSRYATTAAADCSALMGEPPLDELGDDGKALMRLMTEIGARLQIGLCGHAGRFVVNAAGAIAARAAAVAEHTTSDEGSTQAVDVDANFGVLQFAPTASPAIQLMRHLAGTVPLITELAHEVARVYDRHADKITGTYQGKSLSWQLRFNNDWGGELDDSVGFLFMASCRVLMLQLLRSSRKAIDDRIRMMDVYAPMFEKMVLYRLAGLDELLRLHNELNKASRSFGAALVEESIDTWRGAAKVVEETLGFREGPNTGGYDPARAGEIIRRNGEVVGIRDARGVIWSMHDLESGIAIQRGVAEDIDPLVKQLDVEGMMPRFLADPSSIRTELERLLTEMQTSNEQTTTSVTGSWEYAFQASAISQSFPHATIPGGKYALRGIHLQVHEQIGEFFRGDHAYPSGVNRLFAREEGRQTMLTLLEFTGTVFLAIVCPPAAVVVGLGAAAYHYSAALEKEQIFESLLDPELVLSRAEVEAELFAAQLGLALSFIPEVGTIVRSGVVVGRSVARHGVRQGARVAARFGRAQVSRTLRKALEQPLAEAFAREMATEVVMDQVMNTVLEPIMQQIEREIAVTGSVGGSPGAQRLLARLDYEQQQKQRADSASKGDAP